MGIVDLKNLDLAKSCISNDKTAFNLTIEDENNKRYLEINNPDLYTPGSELCVVPGKYTCKEMKGYILIKDGEKLSKAKFSLEVVFDK